MGTALADPCGPGLDRGPGNPLRKRQFGSPPSLCSLTHLAAALHQRHDPGAELLHTDDKIVEG